MRIDKAAALKAVACWVELGVLKEEDVTVYKLLEVAEEASAGAKTVTRAGRLSVYTIHASAADDARPAAIEEESAIVTVQQQQAEQMKIYWRVRRRSSLRRGIANSALTDWGNPSISRACSRIWGRSAWCGSRTC